MTVKEWMLRAWRLDEEIDQLRAAKQEAFDRATNTTPSYSPAGGSASPDPHKYDALAAYAEKIDTRERELLEIKTEIQSVIEKVSTPTLRTVLLARYINCRRLEEIAVELGCSYQWACELNGRGLQEVAKFLPALDRT